MLEMADLRFPVEMTGNRYKIEILMSRKPPVTPVIES